ncbi:hypothetical protein J4414_03035 [Candidatus Woesearchaeota archaeon]|nr:hypothetical protein [Candidatus Woesearchaeota archaeon]
MVNQIISESTRIFISDDIIAKLQGSDKRADKLQKRGINCYTPSYLVNVYVDIKFFRMGMFPKTEEFIQDLVEINDRCTDRELPIIYNLVRRNLREAYSDFLTIKV